MLTEQQRLEAGSKYFAMLSQAGIALTEAERKVASVSMGGFYLDAFGATYRLNGYNYCGDWFYWI